jgi:RNA polymerase sigma-70 factor (ECF subfamily)
MYSAIELQVITSGRGDMRAAVVLDLHQAGIDAGARSFAAVESGQAMDAAVGGNDQGMAVATMGAHDYNRCVEEHSDALHRFVLKQLRDRDEAKDIVQESFLRLWMKLDQVQFTKARSYLFTTARNLIVDRSRRRKYVARYHGRHEDMLVTHQPKAGVKEVVDRALATLTPVQRSLVVLRDMEGHSYEDIVTLTGLEMTKVKVYLFRARKAMREYIGDLALVA